MSNPVFELRKVGFSYLKKYPALRDIDLTIQAGQKLSVIGANGSGKSTLLHLLDGLIFPDQGSMRVFGAELKESNFNDEAFSRRFRKKVGFVFQNPDIQLFCPTVRDDIVFGPLQLGVEKKDIGKRLEKILDTFEIKDLLDRSPHQLSVGEKRKVAIASILMIDPDVLILDEPTAGLDPTTTRHIIDFVLAANASGKTIITSTHDLHIVEEISDVVYVFSQEKKIVASGPAGQILADNQLLQAHNLVHMHAHRHKDKVHAHPHVHLDHHTEE